MSSSINTDAEALYEIRNALIEFKDNISSVKDNLNNYFYYKESEIKKNYEKKLMEFQEGEKTKEGRTDSFACDTCGGHMYLKVREDEVKCRENGCNGTMKRVYLKESYSSRDRNKDIEELEEIKRLLIKYNYEKNELTRNINALLKSSSGESGEIVNLISKCIYIIEQYLNFNISNFNNSNSEVNVKTK